MEQGKGQVCLSLETMTGFMDPCLGKEAAGCWTCVNVGDGRRGPFFFRAQSFLDAVQHRALCGSEFSTPVKNQEAKLTQEKENKTKLMQCFKA